MGALFHSRGWLPIVESPGYSRHLTSVLGMQLLKRGWRSGESTRLPPVWPSFSILEATRYVGRRVKFFSGYSSVRASLTTSSHSAFFTSLQTFNPTGRPKRSCPAQKHELFCKSITSHGTVLLGKRVK